MLKGRIIPQGQEAHLGTIVMVRCTMPERAMKKTLITAAAAIALGILSVPTLAASYVVNGHAASTAEVQYLVSRGFQPGAWVVNGFAITAADTGLSAQPVTESNEKTCWYVLDVQLCD